MTAPHVASDDTAILAAHDQRPEIAAARLRAAVDALIANPTSQWLRDAALGAVEAVHTEGIATMCRENMTLRERTMPGRADLLMLDVRLPT